MSRALAIIDYKMGNQASVINAFRALGCQAELVSLPEKLHEYDKIVFPGVGAFADGMNNVINNGWIEVLEEEVRHKGKFFLGICLGMQLLASVGTENGVFSGLNWISGRVEKIVSNSGEKIRVPHIGWNDVKFSDTSQGIFKGLGESEVFYFVHSYVFRPDNLGVISSLCDYGGEFAASLQCDNIFATQFHPEKSQNAGLTVLKNFLEIRG